MHDYNYGQTTFYQNCEIMAPELGGSGFRAGPVWTYCENVFDLIFFSFYSHTYLRKTKCIDRMLMKFSTKIMKLMAFVSGVHDQIVKMYLYLYQQQGEINWMHGYDIHENWIHNSWIRESRHKTIWPHSEKVLKFIYICFLLSQSWKIN